MLRPSRVVLLPLVAVLAACPPPPNVPTRTDLLPLVTIEIKDTPTQSDDYIAAGSFAPARIRLTNGDRIAGSVLVTLRNVEFQEAPQLRFASSGTPSLSTLTLTLPMDGSWVPFTVGPQSGQSSQRDKDAIIEILESRPDGIVLGRKSLMVGGTPTTGTAVVVSIGSVSHFDDYVAWRPVRATVRLAASSGSPMNVTLRNMTPAPGGGRLVFGADPELTPGVQPPPMLSTLNLSLPADGSSVTFWVAGEFGRPSANDKDAVLEVIRAGTAQVLGREGMMVRIRKNANTLTASERQRFTEAMARVNLTLGNYVDHQHIHSTVDLIENSALVTSQGHSGPAFLAWHRPYILRLERELQAVDPSVALHYWRFDEPAPNVFSSSFMGGPAEGGFASFDPGHPLGVWNIEGLSNIRRSPAFGPNQIPSLISTEASTLALGGSGSTAAYSGFRTMEGNPHGRAHTQAGSGGGWVGSISTAVRDPLFFMLHANVDRLWAKWQWLNDRQNPADALAYSPQGAYPNPGSGTIWLGHYADDQMWPWDGRTGFVVTGDVRTRRPATAPGGRLPVPAPPAAAIQIPRPRQLIDYDQWTLLGVSGLGYAYDDVPFHHSAP